MKARNLFKLLVCLVFLVGIFASAANAYSIVQASALAPNDDLLKTAAPDSAGVNLPLSATMQPKEVTILPPSNTQPRVMAKATGRSKKRRYVSAGHSRIHKVKAYGYYADPMIPTRKLCFLPEPRVRGWNADAEALFARIKGKVRYTRGLYSYNYYAADYQDIDLNSTLNVPDHWVLGSYSLRYHFRPKWTIRYSIMPMQVNGSGTINDPIVFGGHQFGSLQNAIVKWERIYQRVGLIYQPIKNNKARVSIFGDYVRLDDKITVGQVGCCSSTMNNDLNMAMAGLEFERCLKTGRLCNSLSLECRAGVAFLDDSVGADVSSGLKYSIPLGSGRWGYVSGGYRYINYKTSRSDAYQSDTTAEGGYVRVGFLF